MQKTANVLFTIILSIVLFRSYAQVNLVPNPSFEDTTHNWGAMPPYSLTSGLFQCKYWMDPNNASADYFNLYLDPSLSVPSNYIGWQHAHTGKAYAGFADYVFPNSGNPNYIDLREYIQAK